MACLGRRVAVGFADGAVKIIELKSSSVQSSVGAGEAHSLAVSCLDTYSDNNIIATGGGDGKITLFKTQPSLKVSFQISVVIFTKLTVSSSW